MVFSGGDDSNRDPTHWWAQSPARVRTMLQSSGFYDAVQLPRTEARFHAVHARRSKEADAFVAACTRKPHNRRAEKYLAKMRMFRRQPNPVRLALFSNLPS
jgi:hypothetical protein